MSYVRDMFDTPDRKTLYDEIEDNPALEDSGKLTTQILDSRADIERQVCTDTDDFKEYLKEEFGID